LQEQYIESLLFTVKATNGSGHTEPGLIMNFLHVLNCDPLSFNFVFLLQLETLSGEIMVQKGLN
jgi:hypothetical protein